MRWLRSAGTIAVAAAASTIVASCSIDIAGLEAPAHDAGSSEQDAVTMVDAASEAVDASVADAAPAEDAGPNVPVDASRPPDSAPSPITTTVTVPASRGMGCPPFYASNITVPAGATLKVTATGSWMYHTALTCGPDGSTLLGTIYGNPYGTLLGQIAGGAAFAVGSSYSGTVNEGGELTFGNNDDECMLNVGSLTVSVTITP